MRIGEVAKISRCPAVTIRYYEKIGLLPNAKRTAANYRIYDQNDLERLRFIRHCRNHGMSLADIEKLLSIKDDGSALHDGDIVAIIESHRKNIKAQIASLEALLRKLDELVADPAGSREKGDRIIETLGAPCPDCSDYAKFSHAPSRKGMRAGEG